jgi:release factor glutamine methyltransferase
VETNPALVARLRAAGCVWAEDEAELLTAAAASPAELDAMAARRVAGEPLEQVVGWAEFHGLRVFVDPGVFVPRRRSEYLVDVALRLIAERTAQDQRVAGPSAAGQPVAGPPVIVDLCCGTGALGLAVAAATGAANAGPVPPASGQAPADRPAPTSSAPPVRLYAADLDPAAVACARRNVEPAGGQVYAGDLFAALPGALRGQIDVLICNAPYVPTSDLVFMPAEAREHEAPMALDGGDDGLAVLRRAAAGAGNWLAPGGVLLVETSERQALSMAAAMSAAGLTPAVHEDDESGATVVTGMR